MAEASAAFLGGGEAVEVASGGAAKHPGEPMGDAMAVFVGGAGEGFAGSDFQTGFEVEDFFAGEMGVEGVGAMDADAGFGLIPVAFGAGLEGDAGGRGEEFEGVMGIVKLGRGGGEDEFELFVGGDDGQEGGHEFAEVADEGDFVEQDGAGPGAGGGEVGGDDFGAGVNGGAVIDAELEALLGKEFGETGGGDLFGARATATDDFFAGHGIEGFKFDAGEAALHGLEDGQKFCEIAVWNPKRLAMVFKSFVTGSFPGKAFVQQICHATVGIGRDRIFGLGINGGLGGVGELFEDGGIAFNKLTNGLVGADGGLDGDFLGEQE